MTAFDAHLAEAARRDDADPLRHLRDRFALPAGVVYLDGNSLGPLPKSTAAAMADAVTVQWGDDLIGGWTRHGWIDLPRRVGGQIAGLLGVGPDEVLVVDSVSVNLFKVLTALVRNSGSRRVILTEAGNFPTDLHVAEGVADVTGCRVVAVGREELVSRIDEQTAVVLLTHVHYRTAERFDIHAIQRAAGDVPVVWDLSHSVGAVPLRLADEGARYAVGCGYKYLNGGPGAPGFVHIARDRQNAMRPALQGWMGDARPFDFRDDYRPAAGIDRFRVGTPPVLSTLALAEGVATFGGVDMDAAWRKSQALFDLLVSLMAEYAADFRLITPTAASRRGSHASFAHENAWPINNALIARGVIGDFRTPDVLRLGLTPLYTRFVDIVTAVERLAAILASGEWQAARFQERREVT